MIYVQHLLGVGHLQRALLLAEALAGAGFRVELVSGGTPQAWATAAGVRLTQLPPLRSADGSFTRLLDEFNNEIDAAWQDRRKQQLLDLFYRAAPAVLITETFPFGRRALRFELMPLLEAAQTSRSCRLVIASIRDILQPKTKPGRDEEICELIGTYYDHVLVHGDERIAQLGDSFALAETIRNKISYSGYICKPIRVAGGHKTDEVVVSAGGSATGLEILTTAIAARALSCLADHHWRILVSPMVDEVDFHELQTRVDQGFTVERNRADFPALINQARLSISQAGYNTITDILQTNTPAIVIPYAEADEIEQSQRARLLQQHGRLVVLAERELSALALATAIEKSSQLSPNLEVRLDGAARSAALIAGWLSETNGIRQ